MACTIASRTQERLTPQCHRCRQDDKLPDADTRAIFAAKNMHNRKELHGTNERCTKLGCVYIAVNSDGVASICFGSTWQESILMSTPTLL
jgi:hypothetical protein